MIASDQNWSKEFYSRAPCGHNVTTPWQLLSPPGHSGDGWSLLMVSVNFCVGLRVLTFLLSSSRQRSHCQAKLNFLTKEEAVVSDEPDPGRGWLVGAGLAPPGNPWQRKLTILLYTSLTLTEKSGHGWAWALLLCQSLKRKCFKFSQSKYLFHFLWKAEFSIFHSLWLLRFNELN